MISKEQFLLRQPNMPDVTATDPFYYELCVKLVEGAKEKGLFPSYPEKVMERAALALIGYYQDVVSDAGIWRSFITECRRLYGYPVPFFTTAETEYMDFEMNEADVKFMVWYAFSMNYENRRVCYPLDKELMEGASVWYSILEEAYDEAPIPQDYRLASELELHSEEDREGVMKLANWLFLHCYLMTPAYAMTLAEISSGFDLTEEDDIVDLQKRLDASMWQDPTGPLALYLGEWLYLVVEHKPAPEPKNETPEGVHKYYTAFTRFTGGKTLQFFATYDELNKFFIEALGWAPGENHLEQVKNDRDFVLMVDEKKGMLLARNIAKCISCPDNHLYDRNYAKDHAIELLTERGKCPGDLLRYIGKHGWFPDAVFPGTTDNKLVGDSWDFISRCYLQQYYRGD